MWISLGIKNKVEGSVVYQCVSVEDQEIKVKLGVVGHTCNPKSWEAEAEGLL